MTTTTIQTRSSKDEVKARIQQLVQNGLGKQFRSQLVYEYMKIVQEGYDVKSEGGTDQFGVKWEPLTTKTIASKPISPFDRKEYKLGNTSRRRGLLTETQDKKWKGIFYSKFKKLAETLPIEEAKEKAAQYAWAVLKGQGARTKIGTLGDRKVPIMKATGELYEACCAGEIRGDDYIPPKNQIVEDSNKQIKITIDVDHAQEAMRSRPVFPPEKAVGIAITRALDVLVANFQV